MVAALFSEEFFVAIIFPIELALLAELATFDIAKTAREELEIAFTPVECTKFVKDPKYVTSSNDLPCPACESPVGDVVWTNEAA